MFNDNKSTAELGPSFRHDIQGLRAFAIIFVIIFHYNKDVLSGGFVGVDIFLVVSGFLITTIIVKRENSKPREILKFYLNRFFRIYPAYFFMLIVTTLIFSLLLTYQDFSYFKDSLFKSFLFLSNNYFSDFGGYFLPDSTELPLLHTWSLSVEMQFYLCLPILTFLIPNKNVFKFLFFISISLLLLDIVFEEKNHMFSYYSFLYRFPEFMFGSLVVYAYRLRYKINNKLSGFLSL